MPPIESKKRHLPEKVARLPGGIGAVERDALAAHMVLDDESRASTRIALSE